MPDEGIWSAQDTTPTAIDEALRELLKQQHAKSEADVPARVLNLVEVVLIDSINEPDPRAAVQRAQQLVREAYVVDLAWLRSTPWRERITATFDPLQWRPELDRLSTVTVRHRSDSGIAGALVF